MASADEASPVDLNAAAVEYAKVAETPLREADVVVPPGSTRIAPPARAQISRTPTARAAAVAATVAMSGDVLAIAMPIPGELRLLGRAAGEWREQARFDPIPAGSMRHFVSLAVSGSTVVAAVPPNGRGFGEDGVVRTYRSSPAGVWTEAASTAAPDAAKNGLFGLSVALDDNVLAVAAPLAEPGGRVALFSWQGDRWSLTQELDGRRSGDRFGCPIGWASGGGATSCRSEATSFIYGVSLFYPYEWGYPANVHLARATAANLTNYLNWEFLKPSGGFVAWLPGPPTHPSDLWAVADGSPFHLSVRRITINGTSAYLMVQSHAMGSSELVIRVSPDIWGGIAWANYFYPDQNTMVKAIGDDTVGIDKPCDQTVYQQTGQWDISDLANNQLLVSYYCGRVKHNQQVGHGITPWNCNSTPEEMYWRGTLLDNNIPQDLQTTLEGRIRFYKQDVTKLRPWCTSGIPSCDMP